MKVMMSQVLTNFAGQPLTDGTVKLTLAVVASNALLGDDPALASAKDKLDRFNLAQRVYVEGEVELSLAEAALIGDRAAALFPTIVAGQVIKLLEACAARGVRLVGEAS